MQHKAGKGVHSNFEQYDLGIPDMARLDNAAPAMREMPFFHAIISDPPYGIRAGARRSGVPDEKKKPIPGSSATLAIVLLARSSKLTSIRR